MKSVRNFFHDRMSSSNNSNIKCPSSPPLSPNNHNEESKEFFNKSSKITIPSTPITTLHSCNSEIKQSSSAETSSKPSSFELDIAPPPACDISGSSCDDGVVGNSTAGIINSISGLPPPSPNSITSSPGSIACSVIPKSSSSTPDRHSTGVIGLFSSKSQKGRRKISLPWFRQNSVSTPHAALSRQHTIDSPGSFKFFRQTSRGKMQLGNLEVTWVVSDYSATPGSNELTVTKGQQVEVVEATCPNEQDFCLVRLNPQTDDGAAQEGLVPISILKPPPGSQKANRNSKENTDTIQEQVVGLRVKSDALTSSSTKRRGFSGRKWLPQPLRKLSQGKVDKPPVDRTLVKKNSEKNMKLSEKQSENDDELTISTSSTFTRSTSQTVHDYEGEEEVTLELPPPMKPIQEPCVISNGIPNSYKDLKENSSNMVKTFKKMENNTPVDLSEIEQIVKEKTEQHEVKSKLLKPFDINESDNNDKDRESNNDNLNDNNEDNNSELNDVESAQKKRICALQELLSTEELYIQDLSEIVNGYIMEIRNLNSEIPLPDDLKGGKERMVFGNIEAIYEWHRDFFLKALQRSLKNPPELGQIVKRYERKFQMYHVYCQNKPVSEHIVSEHILYFDQIRQKLKHRLDLSDMLIKPVQRITKYELLLKEITKQTERAGLLDELSGMQEAYNVMKIVCKTVNDMMDVRRLQRFEGKITAQGKLLMHGPLMCTEEQKNLDRTASVVQKPRELQVFLFEQSIIFSDIIGKKTQFTSPSYIYRSHIQVNKMQLEELPNNKFLLKSTDPHRTELTSFVCTAPSLEQNKDWLETIRNILQSQHDFLIALQSPIEYQNNLTKDS